MNSLRLVLATLLLPALAQAQTMSVIDASRTLYTQGFGYDYDFNNGEASQDANSDLEGAWQKSVFTDLDDWYDYDVSDALAVQDSLISSTVLSFALDANATTAGHHFQADSNAESHYSARFDLAHPVHYRLVGQASSSYGYNEAHVRLVRERQTVAALDASYGASANLTKIGWLESGQYVLAGSALAFAYGTSNVTDAQDSFVQATFEVFDAADFELDGDVDQTDWTAFFTTYVRGGAGADVDGDGQVGGTDYELFAEIWKSAMNP